MKPWEEKTPISSHIDLIQGVKHHKVEIKLNDLKKKELESTHKITYNNSELQQLSDKIQPITVLINQDLNSLPSLLTETPKITNEKQKP